MIMHDTKQDIDYMYAQGWPNVGTNIFSADLYGNVGFPGKWSYSQLIEQSKKSSLLNFVTNGYRTTPNVGVYSGTSKTSGHYSFYREEVVANGTNSQITHRDPVAINTQAPQIVDYNVAANHTYRYTAYPTDMNDTVFATTAINPNATGSDPSLVQTPMINWSIAELLPVGPTTDIPSVKKEYQVNKSAVWIFKFNVSTGENSQNIGRDQVTNLAQYNKMAQGKRNYMSGTVSCYLGSELVRCTGEYTEEPRFAPLTTSNKSIAMLKAWRKFVASKNPKLLKDRKGNKYIVQLTSVSDRVDDNVPCQPSFVNFSWQEIESSEDVLITGGYENDTTVSVTGSTMQTIKLPTPIIHGAAFIGDTVWNSELDTPAFEDSYHFIFSIENDPLTDYYEWSLTDITSPTNSTGYEKQTVRKENIAPIIIPNSDGSGSLDNVGAFQEGHKYMLRVRGRADNSAIEDSNYYSQVIECKWLWGPNKYLELQDKYYNANPSTASELLDANWGFAGLGIINYSYSTSYGSTLCIYTIGNAYNKNTVKHSNFVMDNSFSPGDNITITITGPHNFEIGDTIYYSTAGDAAYSYSSTIQFGNYRNRATADGTPTASFYVNDIAFNGTTSVLSCLVLSGSYSPSNYSQLWSYKIGTQNNDWDQIYPWSEIKRSCGTWKNGYYQRVAYENMSAFATDGSQGDVFVEYPLFYYADFIHNSSISPTNNFLFPFKYVSNDTSTVRYATRWSFITSYPYHYGIPNTGVTSAAPTCLPSSLHINYNTEQTYAVGFLSAYELSKINGAYHSVSKQIPVTQETGVNLLTQISQQQPGLVGLKYTDHNMVCLLMAMEFGTYNINLALSGFLYPDKELLLSKENDSCYKITTHPSLYDLYKSYFYPSQRVKLEGGYSVEDTVPYLLRKSGGGLNIGDRENDKLVGGTIAWNQMVDDTQSAFTGFTPTITNHRIQYSGEVNAMNALFITKVSGLFNAIPDHKYYICGLNKYDGCGVYFYSTSVQTIQSQVSTTKKTGWVVNCTISGAAQLYLNRGGAGTIDIDCIPQMYDLTLMFGSTIADYVYSLETATAGAGIAWLKSHGFFTKDYYAYNAGELMSVNTSAHNMRGFNQWDEEWESGVYDFNTGAKADHPNDIRCKNLIPICPATTYHCHNGTHSAGESSTVALFYDGNYNLIPNVSTYENYMPINNVTFTTPDNAAYMTFYTVGTTYHNDICINISDPAKNGTYEPYHLYSYPLDSSLTLNGLYKLDADNKLYCDGDTYESDGTVTRNYGIVDLGSLSWTYATSLFSADLPDAKTNGDSICLLYTRGTGAVPSDKQFQLFAGAIHIADSAYSDAAAFTTAMSGVYLVYELATPTTETADPFTNPQTSTPNGTEEYVDAGVEAGTRDIAVPVGHETMYQNTNTIVEETNQIGAVVPDDNSYTLYLYLTKASNTNYQTICPIEWKTGATDDLPGSTNSLRGSNNLFAPCKYRGLENPFGNVGKLCSDMRGYSTSYGFVGETYCYYYKNANAITDTTAGGSFGTNSGAYFRSNCYAVPTTNSNSVIPIQNANSVTIGSYFVAYINTANSSVSGCLNMGCVGPFDLSSNRHWYGIQIGGGAPFNSYIDSTNVVPTGPYNANTTQYFTNAAFGTRFSTHRTHY